MPEVRECWTFVFSSLHQFLSVLVLLGWFWLSPNSFAVKRLHDQDNSCKRKHWTEGLLIVSEGWSMNIIMVGSRQSKPWSSIWELISWSIGSRQIERDWAWCELLKPQSSLPVIHLLQQCHTHSSKVTPPSSSQIVHQLVTKHLNIWVNGNHSHSDHHTLYHLFIRD